MEDIDKNNQIGSYLKCYFAERNITQKEIQEDLNVSQQYVSGILNGKKSIGKKLAEKLSILYGVDQSFLLTGVLESIKTDDAKKMSIKDLPHGEQMEIINSKLEYLIKAENLNNIYIKTILVHLGLEMEKFKPLEDELDKIIKTVTN